jgi:predicted O-methyltransferase YrrM
MKLLRSGQTDKEILASLLRPEDAGESYLAGSDYYAWYQAVAACLAPRIVGEIGVRFGYSLKAMLSAAPSVREVVGWDNESYHPRSLDVALRHLRQDFPGVHFRLLKVDTQELSTLQDSRREGFDLLHVDGDHTFEGAKHDLDIAWAALKQGGFLLCDDLSCEPVRRAFDAFLKDKECISYYIPTVRGLGCLRK